jgi:hypothetical protein
MAVSFLPGALLGHAYELNDGMAVRLRLARASDVQALRDLLERDSRPLSAAELLRFDPQREYVLCATALLDGHETLLGIGSIGLDDEATEPALLVTDDRAGDGLRRLLSDALVGTATTITRARAA